MKDFIVGLAVGMAAGIALGMTGPGRKVMRDVKSKLENVCDCAEKEMRRIQNEITAQPDAQQ